MKAILAILAAPLLASAAQPVQQCAAPVAVPQTITTPGATYYSSGEPPARFARVPTQRITVKFGQPAIDSLCGRPPCGMMFLGCVNDNQMALPDPYKTDSAQFAKIVRHELAHVNGRPATHGE